MPRSASRKITKRGPRRDARLSPWQMQSFLAMTARRGKDRSLYVAVNGDAERWFAMAVEGPQSVSTPAAVLNDHGHKVIGSFASMEAAKRAARAFAKRWQRGAKIEDCACPEI